MFRKIYYKSLMFVIIMRVLFLIPVEVNATTMAEYLFDEETGTVAYDETANNNDGTLYGSVARADYISFHYLDNCSLEFDGEGVDSVRVPDAPSLNPSNAITIETCVYLKGTITANFQRIFSKGTYTAFVNNSNRLVFRIETTSGTQTLNGCYIKQNEWHHLAFTYDKDGGTENMRMYLNGVLSASTTWSGLLMTSTA